MAKEYRTIQFEVPVKTWNKFKVRSMSENSTEREILIDLIDEYLAKE